VLVAVVGVDMVVVAVEMVVVIDTWWAYAVCEVGGEW
jgi:hypothetical protein